MRPSETGIYDLLQCTQKWTIPYSQIYVEGEPLKTSQNGKKESGDAGGGAIEGDPELRLLVSGASIDISCETNGDIDAMECRWNSTKWMNPTFRYR